MQRCTNSKDKDYKHYGGRGITVCSEWFSYDAFYEWALSSGYSDNLTLDRKDNNKGYAPDNCKWSTMKEQSRNRRNTTSINGKCLVEISEETGININTLWYRYTHIPNSSYEDLIKPVNRRIQDGKRNKGRYE